MGISKKGRFKNMKHGFIKVATATPHVTVADCQANLQEILQAWDKAEEAGVKLLVYPELCLTGYSCYDLFFSGTLILSAQKALEEFLARTQKSSMISIIGLPLVVNNKLYNCGVICQKGKILGAVPKTHLPNYGALSELRYFAAPPKDVFEISLCQQTVPFGTRQIFVCQNMPLFRFCVELGEDLSVSVPPSCSLTAAGALLIANLSASFETVGADAYRRSAVTSQSARTVCAYLYANCGDGESTTDVVFGGHSLIAENGQILAEKMPFSSEVLCLTEIDTERLESERQKQNTYSQDTAFAYRQNTFSTDLEETVLTRSVNPFPFIPQDEQEKQARFKTILAIQAKGLAQRIERSFAKTCVIGISGGLDSCLAVLVAVRAMDLLQRPRTDIIGVTMPCFGTTHRTKSNAEILCSELGIRFQCVNITSSVQRHFADIGHEESVRNVVYENAQARERTQVLMDLANEENGLVIGTGDLSELALGWATYNGDHMSMYGVNGGIPKTLIRHIVAFCADCAEELAKPQLAASLRDILDTPVSPELLPADQDGNIAQKTEDLVGPYEIHDFYLYYMLRFGYAPDKLYRLAKVAFDGRYSDEILLKWLKNFVRRFFSQQFKRSCLPDGPKVGTVGISPRGDWKMPSDASAREWLNVTESL